MSPTVVGALGSRRCARVDERGLVTPNGARFELGWWVGAEDRRHHPDREAAVRQRRLGPGPVIETAMRVPGGDAVQRVYAVGGPADAVVVEIENASAVPFAVGFVPRPPPRGRGPELELPRPPLRREQDGRGEALVYPVAHRTRLRLALKLHPPGGAVDLAGLPDAADVGRGWEAQLRRGTRVDLPDEPLQVAVDAARADLLLAADDVAALEDWGFDAEAREAWASLSSRRRRRARQRPDRPPRWDEVRALRGTAGSELLMALRAVLVHETDRGVALLTECPPGWAGPPLEVHDAPTRSAGRVSYAIRWHGDRPALLWECERSGVRLCAPGLDPAWSTHERRGEALLAGSVDA